MSRPSFPGGVLALAAVILALPAAAHAQVTTTELAPPPGYGYLIPTSINDAGDVCATIGTTAASWNAPSNTNRVFRRTAGGATTIFTTPGFAADMNASGQILGLAHDEQSFFVAQGASTFTVPGSKGFGGGGINDYGQVAFMGSGPSFPFPRTAYLWTPSTPNGTGGTITTLGTGGTPHGFIYWGSINSHGQVAGYVASSAFLWTPNAANGTSGTWAILPSPLNYAFAINDYGQVVGGQGDGGPFYLWTPSAPNQGYSVANPGTLTHLAGLWGSSSSIDLSPTGQVAGGVGSSFYLWTPTTPNGTSGATISVQSCNPAAVNTFIRRGSINAAGTVVGTFAVQQGSVATGIRFANEPFVWIPSVPNGTTGRVILLPFSPGDDAGSAFGINASGTILSYSSVAAHYEPNFAAYHPQTSENGLLASVVPGPDTDDPVFRWPPGDLTVQAPDASGAYVWFNQAFACDYGGPVTITYDKGAELGLPYEAASGTLFPVGDTLMTVHAIDGAGNEATMTFTITVLPPPSGNTTPEDPVVEFPDLCGLPGGRITFGQVTSAGDTEIECSTTPIPGQNFETLPANAEKILYFAITTDAGFTGSIEVCLPYQDPCPDPPTACNDPANTCTSLVSGFQFCSLSSCKKADVPGKCPPTYAPTMYHWERISVEPEVWDWVDLSFTPQGVEYTANPFVVCGTVTSFSPYATGLVACADRSTLSASTDHLWPPDHRMATLTVSVGNALASCSGAPVTLVVESDEPDDAPGGGDAATIEDIVILDAAGEVLGGSGASGESNASATATVHGGDVVTLHLRVERKGSGDGRTYTIRISGPNHESSAAITVPHDSSAHRATCSDPDCGG